MGNCISEKKSFWLEHYSNWQRSGKTQKEYCKSAGINYHTFKYNHFKVRSAGENLPVIAPSRFIQMQPTHAEVAIKSVKKSSAAICVHVSEEFKVSVEDNFLPQTLRSVISVLKDF